MKKTYEDLKILYKAENGVKRAGLKTALDLSFDIENESVVHIRNQVIESALRYNELCRPDSVRAGIKNVERIDAENKMTALITNLMEKIEFLRREGLQDLRETEKAFFERSNFWINLAVSLAVACIPMIYAHYVGNSEINELKTRLEKLEIKLPVEILPTLGK